MKKCNPIVPALLLSGIVLGGCCLRCNVPLSETQNVPEETQEGYSEGKEAALEETEEIAGGRNRRQEEAGDIEGEADARTAETKAEEEAEADAPRILHFVDVFGEEYQVEVNPDVETHSYQSAAFLHDGGRLSYQGDDRYSYRLGVDVSYHNGYIDWERVRSAGYEFAFLRIGYRGYGKEGNVCLDKQFYNNIKNAQAAGIDVGVYFFSQAINEEEAEEEAEFVLTNLAGYEIPLPVVYDPENILDDEARTDNVTGAQFTKNTIVFCERIAEAGYQPMIYSNMLWEAFQLDLEQLSAYPIWYADYEPLPQTPYAFDYWQYSNEGIVDGIGGAVDLNIHLMEKKD